MFIHTLNFMKIHVKITNVIQKYAANSKYAKENKLHDVYTPIFEMIQEKIKPYYE